MKNPLQLKADARWRARLLEEGIRPECKDATRRPRVSIGTEHDDGRARAGIEVANPPDEFESVDVGQVKIRNHSDRGAVFVQNVQSLRGIARVAHRTAVMCFQRHLQSRNGFLAIFHKEDKWR
jgi:hypothetical protein